MQLTGTTNDEKADMQTVPKNDSPSQVVEESPTPKDTILARIYASILTWNKKPPPFTPQRLEENPEQSGAESEEKQEDVTEPVP